MLNSHHFGFQPRISYWHNSKSTSTSRMETQKRDEERRTVCVTPHRHTKCHFSNRYGNNKNQTCLDSDDIWLAYSNVPWQRGIWRHTYIQNPQPRWKVSLLVKLKDGWSGRDKMFPPACISLYQTIGSKFNSRCSRHKQLMVDRPFLRFKEHQSEEPPQTRT